MKDKIIIILTFPFSLLIIIFMSLIMSFWHDEEEKPKEVKKKSDNEFSPFFKKIDEMYKRGEITFPYECEYGTVRLIPTADWKYAIWPKEPTFENNFTKVICNT